MKEFPENHRVDAIYEQNHLPMIGVLRDPGRAGAARELGKLQKCSARWIRQSLASATWSSEPPTDALRAFFMSILEGQEAPVHETVTSDQGNIELL